MPPVQEDTYATNKEINQMLEIIIDKEFLKQSTQSESFCLPTLNVEYDLQIMIHFVAQTESINAEQTMKSPIYTLVVEFEVIEQAMKQSNDNSVFVTAAESEDQTVKLA